MTCGHGSVPRPLAALGSVEDDPDGQVVGEVLEAVLDPGGDEQEVAGAEAVPGRAVDEPALAPHHDVHLVPAVRRLGIDATGGEQLDAQRAVLVGDDEGLAVRGRELAQPGRRSRRGSPRPAVSLMITLQVSEVPMLGRCIPASTGHSFSRSCAVGPTPGQCRSRSGRRRTPRQPGDLTVPKLDDHPVAVTSPRQVHREEAAPHGGGDPGELGRSAARRPVVALRPVGRPEDGEPSSQKMRYSSVSGIPLLGWMPTGSNSTNSRKTRPSARSSPWSSRNRPTTRSDGLPVGGRGDEARLGPLVLPALHEVLDDEGASPNGARASMIRSMPRSPVSQTDLGVCPSMTG